MALTLLGTAAVLAGCRRASEPGPQAAAPAQPAGQPALAGAKQRGPSSPGAPAALRVGIAIPSFVHAVAWIALERGSFSHHGLAATVEVMGGSAATMRALVAKRIDLGIAGGDAVLKANAAGARLVVLAGLVDRFYHRLVGRSQLADMQALRGKRIGLPFFGGPQDMAVRYALKGAGLAYQKDVRVLSLGKEFNRMAALSRGEIEATTSQSPPSLLQKLGLKVLADLPALPVAFPYAVVVVRQESLNAQVPLFRRSLQALCEAIALYRDPAQHSANLALLAKRLASHSDARGAFEERYRDSGPALISYPPRPNPNAFTLARELSSPKQRAKLRAEPPFATELLEGLIAEGACGRATAPPASRPAASRPAASPRAW